MDNNGNNNFLENIKNQKRELSISDATQIISSRRNTIIITTVALLLIAVLYNFLAHPIYEATVTLKKDVLNTRSPSEEFRDMFIMQTMDEIDTEIEIIKTTTVLESIIKDLDLLVNLTSIEEAKGNYKEYDESLINFNITRNPTGKNLPLLSHFNIDFYNPDIAQEYEIIISSGNTYQIYDEDETLLAQVARSDSNSVFDLNGFSFQIYWPAGRTGDKIVFFIDSFESVVTSLQDNIIIDRTGKTNIFSVSVRSKSPLMAKILANTAVEKFRENRILQKRQTIHYSFDFVDNQLKEISDKLKNAELELSHFKSENKITDIDRSSDEIVSFMSQLESEKIQTDLQLAEYQNKIREMKKEQEKKGYIDQTYLTPGGGGDERSPFSVLLQQLSDAEIKRLELLQRRKQNHPDVVAIDEQIAQIKTRLMEYNQNTMNSYQIMINTLQKKRYNLSGLIEKYSSKLENLPGQETTLIELLRKKNAFEKMYNLLLNKREELRMAEFSKLQDIMIVDPARIPLKPVRPKKIINIAVGLVFGFIIGIVIIFTQEFFQKKVENIDEIEDIFSTSILTVIPKYDKELENTIVNGKNPEDKLVTLMDDQHEFIESYRLLRTRLLNLAKNKNKAFIFTSSEANTGKSTIVANLGINLAMLGKKVLLIDCDLKKTGLSTIFNIPKEYPNYLEYLAKETTLPVPYQPFKKNNTDLDLNILNGGDEYVENSSELLQSDKMKKIIKNAQTKYDFVLIDTPPVTQVVDTLILGNYVQDVIYIIKQSHTNKEGVKFAFDELKQSSMSVCGLVVNAGDLNKSHYKYKYGYKYGYGDYKKS